MSLSSSVAIRVRQKHASSRKRERQVKRQTASQEPTVPLAVAAERIFGPQNQGSAAFSNNFKIFFFGLRRELFSEEVPTVQTDDTPLTTIRFHPNADQILALRVQNILPRLPSVSTRNIMDKSKGDMFVKATALLQVLWLSTQLAIRMSRHLPISPRACCSSFLKLCNFYLLMFVHQTTRHQRTHLHLRPSAWCVTESSFRIS
jgi:hypothetical protein